MKKSLIALSLAAMLFATAGCGDGASQKDTTMEKNDTLKCCKVSEEQIAGIRKPLDLYVGAAIAGDSHVAEPAFTSTATISHIEDGELISLPIKALFDYYDETGKQDASYEITSCTVDGDVAVVSIDSKFGEAEFVDMFSLIKVGDDWKIVSKIFHAK